MFQMSGNAHFSSSYSRFCNSLNSTFFSSHALKLSNDQCRNTYLNISSDVSIQFLKLTINSVADSATLLQDCVKVWREKSTTVPHKFHVSWPLCIEFLDPLMYFLLSIQGVNIKKSLKLGKRYLVNSRWSSEVCILRQISIKIRSEINAINSWRNHRFQQIHDVRNQWSII